MQKSLFIALFMAITTCLFGQSQPDNITSLGNRRTETYYYKKTTYDSVRFTIQGKNDTVFMEELWRNGQPKVKDWVHDSLFAFNNQGLIESKFFYLKADSSILFHDNGQIHSITVRKQNVFYRSKQFDESGHLTMQQNENRIGRYGWYKVKKDDLQRIFYSSFSDTTFTHSKAISWKYDTIFYQNGQPYLIEISNGEEDFIKRVFYNEKGSLIESIAPDSLRLISFKDNVDCYYGLKTVKGDTVFKPRFERIKALDANLMAVYEGTKCRLMHTDATFVTTPDIEDIDAFSNYGELNNTKNWQAWRHAPFLTRYDLKYLFQFTIGDKYGVIDRNGQIIVPPQYRKLEVGGTFSNDSLFYFKRESKGKMSEYVEKGYINRKGESLFPNYIDTEILLDNRYFKVSKSLNAFNYESEIGNVFGLVNQLGKLVLPCSFHSISCLNNDNLFEVAIKKGEKNEKRVGIFNAQKQNWLVDTTGAIAIKWIVDKGAFVVIYTEKTKKYGVIDANGTSVFPLIYDTLSVVNDKRGLLIGRKGKAYQFLNLNGTRPRPTYDFLVEVPYKYDFRNEYQRIDKSIFLAKRKGKWGIVDSNDQILRPFIADYAGLSNDDMFLVDHSIVHYFDKNSFPNEADLDNLFPTTDTELLSRRLVDNSTKLFFFNAQGKVIIPPQYQSVRGGDEYYDRYMDRYMGSYILVDDAQKKRKLISKATGAIIDFPNQYSLQMAWVNCKIIVVSDNNLAPKAAQLAQNLGVVTTNGQLITPCIHSGIAIADPKTGAYFARQDTPTTYLSRYPSSKSLDTLSNADNNWFLYNADGQLVDKTAFRFPIDFNADIGIGMKGSLFGLFRPDGSVVAPPQYKNIRYDLQRHLYYLFENQGLTTTVSVRKRDGTTIVEGNRYDGISPFYGQYALARRAGKVGLIDTLGKEIIAPQDLKAFNTANLLDSINLLNKELDRQAHLLKLKEDNIYIPKRQSLVTFYGSPFSPDSLNISSLLRNTIWHLILEKTHENVMWQAEYIKIQRSGHVSGIYYNESDECTSGQLSEEELRSSRGVRTVASDKTISFILEKHDLKYHSRYNFARPSFYNFYQKNNRWNELAINDLLAIQGEKRWQFNDLITQKVKALKDEEIDCSNTSAFIQQVENRFMLTKDGIDFCFDSHKHYGNFAVVSFTWVELEPFLKMRF